MKTVTYDSKVPPKGKAIVVKKKNESKEPKIPITTSKGKEIKKAEKTEKESLKLKRSELTEMEQRVLDFIKTLDHPANSVEIRDKFNFKLRADARRIFRKLDNLGFGENRKEGRKYRFYVKDKVYLEQPKVEKTKKKRNNFLLFLFLVTSWAIGRTTTPRLHFKSSLSV